MRRTWGERQALETVMTGDGKLPGPGSGERKARCMCGLASQSSQSWEQVAAWYPRRHHGILRVRGLSQRWDSGAPRGTRQKAWNLRNHCGLGQWCQQQPRWTRLSPAPTSHEKAHAPTPASPSTHPGFWCAFEEESPNSDWDNVSVSSHKLFYRNIWIFVWIIWILFVLKTI